MSKLSDEQLKNFIEEKFGPDESQTRQEFIDCFKELLEARKIKQQCLDCARAHLSYFPDHFLIGDIEDYLLPSRPGTTKMGKLRPYDKQPEAYDKVVTNDKSAD